MITDETVIEEQIGSKDPAPETTATEETVSESAAETGKESCSEADTGPADECESPKPPRFRILLKRLAAMQSPA